MITPLEVQTVEFSKSIRGYNEKEVDEFLNEIMHTIEKHINQSEILEEKAFKFEREIKRYSTIEKTLSDTLVIAKKTANDVEKSAEEKAQIIIDKAELEAKQKINEANQEVLKIRAEYEETKKELIIFKTRFRTLLKSQLETIELEGID